MAFSYLGDVLTDTTKVVFKDSNSIYNFPGSITYTDGEGTAREVWTQQPYFAIKLVESSYPQIIVRCLIESDYSWEIVLNDETIATVTYNKNEFDTVLYTTVEVGDELIINAVRGNWKNEILNKTITEDDLNTWLRYSVSITDADDQYIQISQGTYVRTNGAISASNVKNSFTISGFAEPWYATITVRGGYVNYDEYDDPYGQYYEISNITKSLGTGSYSYGLTGYGMTNYSSSKSPNYNTVIVNYESSIGSGTLTLPSWYIEDKTSGTYYNEYSYLVARKEITFTAV